jgi:hypothetical protein
MISVEVLYFHLYLYGYFYFTKFYEGIYHGNV